MEDTSKVRIPMEHMTLHHEILGSVVTKWCILNTDFGDGFHQVCGVTEAFIPQPRDLRQRNVLRQLWDKHAERETFFAGNHPELGPSTFRNMFFLKPCREHPKGSAERTKQKDVPMNVKTQNNQSHLGTIRILPGKP